MNSMTLQQWSPCQISKATRILLFKYKDTPIYYFLLHDCPENYVSFLSKKLCVGLHLLLSLGGPWFLETIGNRNWELWLIYPKIQDFAVYWKMMETPFSWLLQIGTASLQARYCFQPHFDWLDSITADMIWYDMIHFISLLDHILDKKYLHNKLSIKDYWVISRVFYSGTQSLCRKVNESCGSYPQKKCNGPYPSAWTLIWVSRQLSDWW